MIDEFDKGDIDLANDLLDVLENGRYPIPELARLRASQEYIAVPTDDPGRTATVRAGEVRCHAFPFIVITSNGERPFPPRSSAAASPSTWSNPARNGSPTSSAPTSSTVSAPRTASSSRTSSGAAVRSTGSPSISY